MKAPNLVLLLIGLVSIILIVVGLSLDRPKSSPKRQRLGRRLVGLGMGGSIAFYIGLLNLIVTARKRS
jgi:hypothetical protein